MEDYHAAFLRCVDDVKALDEKGRRVAAMHFGGVAVECLLKHMLVSSIPQGATKEWYNSRRESTWNYGHRIENPGHEYNSVLSQHRALELRVDDDPGVRKLLSDV